MEKRQKQIRDEENWWINSLIGGGIGLAISVSAILIMPLFLLRLEDPNSFVLPGAALCLFMGGAAGSVIGALNSKGKEMLSSLINMALMLSALLLVSFLYAKGFNIFSFLLLTAILIISSLLGAYAVIKTKSSQKRNMNRIMKRR